MANVDVDPQRGASAAGTGAVSPAALVAIRSGGGSMTYASITRALRAIGNAVRGLSGGGSEMKTAGNGSHNNRQIGIGAWMVGLALALGAAPSAHAQATTVTIINGSPNTFKVPPGVTTINVIVEGAGGGGSAASISAPQRLGGRTGGTAQAISATLAVKPGQVFIGFIGQGGGGGKFCAANSGCVPQGGFGSQGGPGGVGGNSAGVNGTQDSGGAGGGGGASSLVLDGVNVVVGGGAAGAGANNPYPAGGGLAGNNPGNVSNAAITSSSNCQFSNGGVGASGPTSNYVFGGGGGGGGAPGMPGGAAGTQPAPYDSATGTTGAGGTNGTACISNTPGFISAANVFGHALGTEGFGGSQGTTGQSGGRCQASCRPRVSVKRLF